MSGGCGISWPEAVVLVAAIFAVATLLEAMIHAWRDI